MKVLLLCCFLALGLPLAAADADADRIALAIEALTRLENVDLNANTTLQERVLKVLDKTRGTASFVKLVQHFKFTNQNAGLLEVAIAQSHAALGKIVNAAGTPPTDRPQALGALMAPACTKGDCRLPCWVA